MPQTRPGKVWAELEDGNRRFVEGTPLHPHQDTHRRDSLAHEQHPQAVVIGCSDSRVAHEILFDQGLGDLFVVRNAGQVASESAVGSLEYAVGPLNVPLLIVLGHAECGAVAAAVESQKPDAAPLPPAIDSLVQQIVPSVHEAATSAGVAAGDADRAEVGQLHVRRTISRILEQSEMISDAVANNTLGIVGATYNVADGAVAVNTMIGFID
ncbi:carbonic anhydrase [Paramicrobacterium agarici]|uniref:Carbonic anhydrase n=1 Tax=Paramicrobacterium agarici TaxID=630514 RepID=A0A2A9E0N0_9MICO|nr:carbonic anhydrase [Microbacterium agarici]PFG31749.1 carbonic anhydrase [Microbacterium agarici]TQO21646.1 carbonic anhydrase [Microbacterium agarici]